MTTQVQVKDVRELTRGEAVVAHLPTGEKKAVVLGFVKKTNKVNIKVLDNKQRIQVEVNHLYKVEKTVEEVALQTAYAERKAAEKAFTNAQRSLSRLQKAGSAIVVEKSYAAAVDLVETTRASFWKAEADFRALKGAKQFAASVTGFDLSTLEDLLQQAASRPDMDPAEKAEIREIYGMIELHRIKELFKLLDVAGTRDEVHTLEFFHGMRKRMISECVTDAPFVTTWQKVFGGRNKNGTVVPEQTVAGIDTAEYREVISRITKSVANYPATGLVNVTRSGISIAADNAAGSAKSKITLQELLKKLKVVKQAVFVRIDKNSTVSAVNNLTTLQKAVGLHKAKIHMEGLLQNESYVNVVKIGFHGNTWTSAECLFQDPLGKMVSETKRDVWQINLDNHLAKLGYGPCDKGELYSKHGYVQLVEEYRATENAFLTEGLSTYESWKKLIVRLQKQAYKEDFLTVFRGVKTFAVGLMTVAEGALLGIDENALAELNAVLERVFVPGGAIPSTELYKYTGTGRVVTGAEAGDSGQKTVLGDPGYLMAEELEDIYDHAEANSAEGKFVLVGLNSTKSARFTSEGAKAFTFNFKGQQVAVWLKDTVEDYGLSTSSVANAYRPVVKHRLMGVAAAHDSLDRVVRGLSTDTVSDMLFQSGEPLAVVVKRLLAAKVIKKNTKLAYTNSQVNNQLAVQYGFDPAKRVLSDLIESSIAEDFRNDVAAGYNLAAGLVPSKDIHDVQLVSLVARLADTLGAVGADVSEGIGKVVHVQVAEAFFNMLTESGKSWLNIGFPNGRSMLFHISQDFIDSVDEASRIDSVMLEGPAAEFVEAIGYHLAKVETVVDEELGTIEHKFNGKMTDAEVDITIDQLTSIRDKVAGKTANRVPVVGETHMLLASVHLKGNATFAPRISKLEGFAKKVLRRKVVCLNFKSPTLWAGSVNAAKLVTSTGDGLLTPFSKKVEEFLAKYRQDEEDTVILMGKSSYISPEKTVKNSNDVDGDEHTLMFVSAESVKGTALANPDHFIDATDSFVAAGGNHYLKRWYKEVKGLYQSENTSQEVTVTREEYESNIQEAIVSAAKAKKDVGLFTSYQTKTLSNLGVYLARVELTVRLLSSVYTGQQAWFEKLRTNPTGLRAFAEAIWSYTVDVQGSLVNLDAMDLAKRYEGAKNGNAPLPAAASFSTSQLSRFQVISAMKVPHLAAVMQNMTSEQRVRSCQQALTKSVGELSRLLFDPETYNLSFDKIRYALPDADDAVLGRIVCHAMLHLASYVAVKGHTEYDLAEKVLESAQKVNGREVPVNLEGIKAKMAEEGKEEVELETIQRFIVEKSLSLQGKRLV